MNKYNKTTFENIKKAAKDYQQEVTTALYKYRQAAEQAKQYKDETGHIAAAKTNARNAIKIAENAFTSTVKAEVGSLKDELRRHLVTAPNDKYLAALNVYNTYGFAPGKAEIAALMEQAAGNSLSLRALDAVLQKTGSKWRVKVPGAEDFESDLEKLERLAEGHIMYSPTDYHTEAVAVFGGTPRPIRRDVDGQYIETGFRWDSVSMLTASGGFTNRIKELDAMAARWTDSVLPTIYDAEVYKGYTDEKTGAEISGAQEFAEDYHATATAGEIVKNPDAGAEHAREQGKARAQAEARAREVVDMYTGGRR